MSTWILDPTLSIEEANARFVSHVPAPAGISKPIEASSLEEVLASSGLKKDTNLNWCADYIVIGMEQICIFIDNSC
jgi:hypothetical protein